MGKRYDYDSVEMRSYQHTTRLFSEACSPVNGRELDLFPWLRWLPNENFRKLKESRAMLDAWVDQELQRVEVSATRVDQELQHVEVSATRADQELQRVEVSVTRVDQ